MLSDSANKVVKFLASTIATLILATAFPAPAQAAGIINPLKGRKIAAKYVTKLARVAAKERQKCANKVENEILPWSVQCEEDPVAFSGAGTGDTSLDEKLTKLLSKVPRNYSGLRNTGLPSAHGLSNVQSPESEDWNVIDATLFDFANQASKTMLGLTFNSVERAVPELERQCRRKMSRIVRGLYGKIIKLRAKCFSRNGLFQGGGFANRYKCLAPALPPGLGTPSTDLKSVDNGIANALRRVRSGLRTGCLDNLEAIGFPGNLSDPSGGVFGQPDLVQVFIEAALNEVQPVLAGIYFSADYCGDGVVNAELGEECDDGDRDSCQVSNCDRNCTISACGNGVACEDLVTPSASEECDDGDAESGNGCTALCVYEFCGDGDLQPELGEECDDFNQDDGDGCSIACLIE